MSLLQLDLSGFMEDFVQCLLHTTATDCW